MKRAAGILLLVFLLLLSLCLIGCPEEKAADKAATSVDRHSPDYLAGEKLGYEHGHLQGEADGFHGKEYNSTSPRYQFDESGVYNTGYYVGGRRAKVRQPSW